MADAGYIWLNALSGLGNNIAESMQQYHKEHLAYDQQAQMAQAMSRLGVTSDGRITAIDPENPDKTIQPLVDKKASEMFLSNNHAQQQKNLGAMEALNRIGMNMAQQTVGPLRQAQLKHAQLDAQRYDVQVGDQTIPATAGQAIQNDLEQQRIDLAKQPKGLSEMQKFRQQEAKDKAFQAKIQASPEYQFSKKYSVLPQQVLSPDVLDVGKQNYRFFAVDPKKGNPTELQPEYDDSGIPRRPSYLDKDTQAYWTPTTSIFRENAIQRNKDGVKTTQYAPDPTGELVNIGGQRIPFTAIQGISNRHDELLKQAQTALKQGANPQALAKQWGALGYNVGELLGP